MNLDLLSQWLFQVEALPARYIIARRIFDNTELVPRLVITCHGLTAAEQIKYGNNFNALTKCRQ